MATHSTVVLTVWFHIGEKGEKNINSHVRVLTTTRVTCNTNVCVWFSE